MTVVAGYLLILPSGGYNFRGKLLIIMNRSDYDDLEFDFSIRLLS